MGATVPTVGAGSALLYEVVLTAFLMFVIMAVATDTRAVGAARRDRDRRQPSALDALFGGPVTGASMNPARSLGPALAAGEWRDFWIYLAGPLSGAALGALAYQLRARRTEAERLMAHVLFVCLHNAGRSQMSRGAVRARRRRPPPRRCRPARRRPSGSIPRWSRSCASSASTSPAGSRSGSRDELAEGRTSW